MTFGLSSLGHSMTFMTILTPVFPLQVLLPFLVLWGSGLWPPVFSTLISLVVPPILKTVSFTYVLMTCEFIFPLHISPLNARLVLLSPPGCLISIFKHKMSKTELLFFSPGPVPPLPNRSSWQVCPSSWPRSSNDVLLLFPAHSTANLAAEPLLLSLMHV